MRRLKRKELVSAAGRLEVPEYDVVALVLQGGGALGAYQAASMRACTKPASGRTGWRASRSARSTPPSSPGRPNPSAWIACASSGKRSAPRRSNGRRTEGLPRALPFAVDLRSAHNIVAAMRALSMGQSGFFKPRFPPPFLSMFSGDAATSFYDTAPLRDTLERLVDFDRLNSGDVRVSVGAVNIRCGNLVYFDTAQRRLRAEHFMASGALPPGFPAVEIDGEYYWDGGMVSNTPLSRVLSSEPRRDTLTFQVDLWPAKGRLPYDLMEVASRQKDIQYSSRTRAITNHMMQMQKMRQALQQVMEKLPKAARNDPDIKAIADLACHRAYNIVHLIYQSKAFEGHSKDFEFGLDAMREHWQSGLEDIRRTLADPRRLDRPAPELGFVTHDVHREHHA